MWNGKSCYECPMRVEGCHSTCNIYNNIVVPENKLKREYLKVNSDLKNMNIEKKSERLRGLKMGKRGRI